jgi:DNA-binding transcriptional regulator LsrR (DeoR family)
MNSPDIPPHVLQFLAERIDSVPQLEALLLLWEDSQRLWSEDELAARLYVSRQVAVMVLQSLQRQQLVTIELAPAAQYRYSAQWDPTGEIMPEVAASYRRHLVPVATFIHSRASTAVREFARAFTLKKDR